MKKIQVILVIAFLLSVYVGFLYTLSMMTDITLLNFYQDFLDASVKTYVNEAQTTNQLIFRLSLFLVVITVILYGFKTRKALLSKWKAITSLVLGLISLILNIWMLTKLQSLNALYLLTDTSWPPDYPLSAEQLGYVEPGHYFVAAGPYVFLFAILISVCFILWMCYVIMFNRKERSS